MKKYLILAGCVLMLLFLGTHHAWSVFVPLLSKRYGYSAFQLQSIFAIGVFVFCTGTILGGRLQDRFGPRPLGIMSAILIGISWLLAWAFPHNYACLLFSMGFLANAGQAVGYIAPIATAIKWFPRYGGLIAGLAAAGYAGGPILLSNLTEMLLANDWQVKGIFGLIGLIYTPIILILAFGLIVPPGQPSEAEVIKFRRRTLLFDRRFWTLCVGMFTGTLPYLVVMGNAKPMALEFGLTAELAAKAITVLAIGNASGRILFGYALDKIGPRRALHSAQLIVIASLIALLAFHNLSPAAFFACLFGIGFCMGSNFAIYPATIARLYGAYVIGSIYPLVMLAQAIGSTSSSINGKLTDIYESSTPGLIMSLSIAVIGSVACFILGRSLSNHRKAEGA